MSTYVWLKNDAFVANACCKEDAIAKLKHLAYMRKYQFLRNEKIRLQSIIMSRGEPDLLIDYFYTDPVKELIKLTDDYIETHARDRSNDVEELLKRNEPVIIGYRCVDIIYDDFDYMSGGKSQ